MLPTTFDEMKERGWDSVDFVYIIGDAYVDHPSFGHAIISRVLESKGYRVGIISQPNWKDVESIKIFGKPRLGFLVSSGNMDSMVNHYTVAKRKRETDAFTPGGKMGKRPDYACTVYCNLIRSVYPKIAIIAGGIEASLRRLAHYDYWSDKLKRSILVDGQADIVSYGMGERSIVEIADALNSGISVGDITFVKGTAFKTKTLDVLDEHILLPSFSQLSSNKEEYARSFAIQSQNNDYIVGKTLVESYDNCYVAVLPPSKPLSQSEMDEVYDLPYERKWHKSYDNEGGVPAFSEVKFSLCSSRGCFGGCSFCALTFHQGRTIQSRSHESIIKEAKLLAKDKDFKGYIHDVGGPTANFREPSCNSQLQRGVCKNKQCLFPDKCKNLNVTHSDYVLLLKKLREVEGVKKVFIRSGIRFDYLIYDEDERFFTDLVRHHISGQLKVAPEHVSDKVLRLMGKPSHSVYQKFTRRFYALCKREGKEQYLVPYLMSSHPGSGLKEAVELAEYLRDNNLTPQQVQDFYPTPSTISTCMYYTGINPNNGEKVNVVRSGHEKAMQRALIQYKNPKNADLVREALTKCGRTDLIGNGAKCLVPKPMRVSAVTKSTKVVQNSINFSKNRQKTAKSNMSKSQNLTKIDKNHHKTTKRHK